MPNIFIPPKLKSISAPSVGAGHTHSVLQSADREPRDDILGSPGDNYDVYKYSWPMSVVRRQPLVYSPRSTSRHNFGLLPDLHTMAGSDLAYRHQSFRLSDLLGMAWSQVSGFFVLSVLVPSICIVVGRRLPIESAALVAPILTLVVVVLLVILRAATLKRLAYAFAVPITGLLLLKALAYVFEWRIVAATLTSAIALFVVIRYWRQPFDFYYRWLYTHPRLRPATRLTTPTSPPPDFRLLVIVLAITVAGPLISTSLSLIAIATLSLLALWRSKTSARSAMSVALYVLQPYLNYGGAEAYAPGVWQPPVPHHTRLRIAFLLLTAFYFAMSAGLSLFMPLSDTVRWELATELFTSGPKPTLKVVLETLFAETPDWWVGYAFHRAFDQGATAYLWCFPIAVAIGSLLPPLVLVAVFRSPLLHAIKERARVEGEDGADGRRVPGLDEDGRPEWQWYVDRMKDSKHSAVGPLGDTVNEADHLFLGVEPHARFPMLLHEKILAEHAYFVGDSGSGKTSLGLMPLLIQLIRGHRPSEEDRKQRRVAPDGGTEFSPIVVLDLKGDPALFHTVKAEAEARGQEFRFFTPEKGKASHYFNPFQSLDSENRSEIQLCHLLLDALSLNHGEGYGRGYYSRQSRQLLLDALTHEERLDEIHRKKPQSLRELQDVIALLRDKYPEVYKDTLELVATVNTLALYDNLAVRTSTKHPETVIHMPTVLLRSQVVYFWLPAAVESVSVREIAKLALYSLLTACIDQQRACPDQQNPQAYVVIDEFQRIAGENFRIILEQARSFGLGVVLANQTVADLKTPDVDLRPAVRTNTRFKRYFSVTDPGDIDALSEASGEELMFLRTWSQSTDQNTSGEYVAQSYENRSDAQSLKPRLTSNDIMAISDHPLDSIVQVSRGSGYTQFAGLPIPVRCTWPLERSIYLARQRMAWPLKQDFPDTVENAMSPREREEIRNAQASKVASDLMLSLSAQKASSPHAKPRSNPDAG